MAHGENAEKHWGKEYWSRRPGNRYGSSPGQYTKKLTHRRERLIARQEIREEIRELLSA